VIASATESESPAEETTIAKTAAPEPTAAPTAVASATAVTGLAPSKVREWSEPSWTDKISEQFSDSRSLLIGALLLAAILLIAWAVIPEVRRRFSRTASQPHLAPADGPSLDETEAAPPSEFVTATRLAGGPPQVSLQLRASEPALRRAAMPLGKNGRQFGNGNGHHGNGHASVAPSPAAAAFTPPAETFAQATESFAPAATLDFDEGVGEPQPLVSRETTQFEAAVAEPVHAPVEVEPYRAEPELAPAVAISAPLFHEPVVAEPEVAPVFAKAVIEPESTAAIVTEAEPVVAQGFVEEPEPVAQGAPVPHVEAIVAEEPPIAEVSAPEPEPKGEPPAPIAAAGLALAGIGALRQATPSFAPQVVNESNAQQSTQPHMATPTQPTPTPVIRTGPTSPMSPAAQGHVGGAPQQVSPQSGGGGTSGMHTAVQLTFSTEIASLQLTPTFKMGSLQLKPTSRIVTMRLAPSQNPQPAMNLQVTFEVSNVQVAGNAIGTIRLTPSQQQRPGIISSPSFSIAGLQLVQGSEAAPVQLTPSTQGQASVHMTGAFQISTVEFSPTFEIASIVLNSTSRNVQVQLPGAGPSAPENAPVFEITNVQLAGSGELGLIQLNPPGAAAKQG
jgi:hypothetical protein